MEKKAVGDTEQTRFDVVISGAGMGGIYGTYRFTLQFAMIWPYDENVRLIGENVSVDLSSARLEPADPADIVTRERAAELVAPLLDQTPQALRANGAAGRGQAPGPSASW